METISPSSNLSLGDLEPQSELQRKSDLLRPLNNTLILLTLIGLVFLIVNQGRPLNLVVIGASLTVNVLVAWLDRTQRTLIAVHIFTYWINLGILYFVYRNALFVLSLPISIIFSCASAMIIMLAGMLLGGIYAWTLVVINVLVVTSTFYVYFFREYPLNLLMVRQETISYSVPIGIFLSIIAVISWLYQRALTNASLRLEMARQRIMRDELLRRDLAVARELQQRLYPPPPLTNPAIRIASRSEPARETSGDFYDFIRLSDDRLGIVVADVTGKSIAAALVMAMSRSTIRSEATRHQSPAEVLRSANLTLCQDNTFKQMITAFYGILDPQTMRLSISNAGHPFPVLRRNGRISELEIYGLPLGAREDASYTEQDIQLLPGDQLVLISDGVIEEQNEQRELFGFERMLATVAMAHAENPHHALVDIWETVGQFRGQSEQSDDITLVVIQVAKDVGAN